MLDVKFIRENLELVEKSAKEKGYKINIKEILELDDKRKKELARVEELRRQRNEIAAKMKGGKPSADLISEGKKVKDELAKLEADLDKVEVECKNKLKTVPNIIFDDVPLGGEECSVEIKKWGGQKKEGVDHLDYAVSRDWVDFERGAKVAGAKFYYLKNELALLENALIQYGLKKVLEKGFTFITVPDLVTSQVLEGTGFNPRTSDQSDEYYIEGEDLALIATAEIALTGYHMNEIIDEKTHKWKRSIAKYRPQIESAINDALIKLFYFQANSIVEKIDLASDYGIEKMILNASLQNKKFNPISISDKKKFVSLIGKSSEELLNEINDKLKKDNLEDSYEKYLKTKDTCMEIAIESSIGAFLLLNIILNNNYVTNNAPFIKLINEENRRIDNKKKFPGLLFDI